MLRDSDADQFCRAHAADIMKSCCSCIGSYHSTGNIEVGKALYTTIEDNQVVLDASTDWVAALPDGITDGQTLSELEEPVAVQQFLHRIQE